MSEEIIALVPVLLLVTRRLGFDAVTAVAISVGAAAVGASFSPINPFQVQIAQKLAGLPLLSGCGVPYRCSRSRSRCGSGRRGGTPIRTRVPPEARPVDAGRDRRRSMRGAPSCCCS